MHRSENKQQEEPFVSELPKLQDIFYIDPLTLSQKPWRSEQVDSSLYFNYGFDEKSWDNYRKRIIKRHQKLQKIQKQTDIMKDNKFKPIDIPHYSLDYSTPIQFGGMGHFYLKKFLYQNLNPYPQEPVDYTPTLKSHKTQNGEQFCYLQIERRATQKNVPVGNFSYLTETYDVIQDELDKRLSDSDQDDDDYDNLNDFAGQDRNMYSQRVGGSNFIDQSYNGGNRHQSTNFGKTGFRTNESSRYDRREYPHQYRVQDDEEYSPRKHRNSIDFDQKRDYSSFHQRQGSRRQKNSKQRQQIEDSSSPSPILKRKESQDSYYKKRRQERDKSQQYFKKPRKFSQQKKVGASQKPHRSHHRHHSNQRQQQDKRPNLKKENSDRKEHHRKLPQPPPPILQKSQSSRSQTTSSQSPKKQLKSSSNQDKSSKEKNSQKEKKITQAKKRLISRPPPKYQPDQSEQQRIYAEVQKDAEVQKNAETHRRIISEKQKQSSRKDQKQQSYSRKSPIKDSTQNEQKRAQKYHSAKVTQSRTSIEATKRTVSKMYAFDSPEEIVGSETSKMNAMNQKGLQKDFNPKSRERIGQDKKLRKHGSSVIEQQKSGGFKRSVKEEGQISDEIEKKTPSSLSKDKKKKHRNHKHRHHHKHGKQSSTLNSIQQESQREEGEIYTNHHTDHSQMKRLKHKHKRDKRAQKAQKQSFKVLSKYD